MKLSLSSISTRCAWLTGFLLGATSIAVAPQAQAVGFTDLTTVTWGGGTLCSAGIYLPNQSSCSFVGNLGTIIHVDASAMASGDASGLHATATVDLLAIDNLGPGARLVAATAVSKLDDTFHLGGTGQGFVDMTVETHGFSSSPGFAHTQLDIAGLGFAITECTFVDAGSCFVHAPVIFGRDMTLLAILSAQATANISGPPGSTGSASALYGNTSFISSISFSSATGATIAVPYTTASGLTYPMAVLAVPEVGTTTLLAAGLALLTVVARRRRAAPEPGGASSRNLG